jgi:hypothetical protein
VFPDEFGRHPDATLEATLTCGGIAEVMEDAHEHHGPSVGSALGSSNVTPLRRERRRQRRPDDRLSDSSPPNVSKTS